MLSERLCKRNILIIIIIIILNTFFSICQAQHVRRLIKEKCIHMILEANIQLLHIIYTIDLETYIIGKIVNM